MAKTTPPSEHVVLNFFADSKLLVSSEASFNIASAAAQSPDSCPGQEYMECLVVEVILAILERINNLISLLPG